MVNRTAEGFQIFFEKLLTAWQRRFNSRPRIPFEEDLDASVLLGPPNADGLIEWLPIRILQSPSLNNVTSAANGFLSPSVVEYLSAYWFLSAGGKFFDHRIELNPI